LVFYWFAKQFHFFYSFLGAYCRTKFLSSWSVFPVRYR
jgi:hypothetical protein